MYVTSNCKNYFHSNIANPKMQEALYRMVGVQETHQNMLLHHSSVKTAELFPQSLEGTVNPVVTKRGSIIQRKAIAISTIPKCCHLARASNDTRRTDCDALFLSRNSYVYQLSLSSDTKIEWQESVLAASQLGSLIVNCWGTKQLGYRVHTSTKYFGSVIMVSRLQQTPCDDHQG